MHHLTRMHCQPRNPARTTQILPNDRYAHRIRPYCPSDFRGRRARDVDGAGPRSRGKPTECDPVGELHAHRETKARRHMDVRQVPWAVVLERGERSFGYEKADAAAHALLYRAPVYSARACLRRARAPSRNCQAICDFGVVPSAIPLGKCLRTAYPLRCTIPTWSHNSLQDPCRRAPSSCRSVPYSPLRLRAF